MFAPTGGIMVRSVPTDSEKIAQSIIPYNRDDSRARYLAARASGFTIREALRLIGNVHGTLTFWRKDQQFVDLENKLPELRKTLGIEFANLEFLRNYRLVLEKDYRVIKQSLYPQKDTEGKDMPLSDQDHNYLIKMRGHYTPQQLQIMETLVKGESVGEFDFTSFILSARKTEERITIEAKRTSVETLPKDIPIQEQDEGEE